jgi:excisionase family DNA binding protein
LTASPGTATAPTLHRALCARCAAEAATEPVLLDVRQAALRLDLSYRHVKRLIAEGTLEAVVVGHNGRGRIYRISSLVLDSYVTRNSKDAA